MPLFLMGGTVLGWGGGRVVPLPDLPGTWLRGGGSGGGGFDGGGVSAIGMLVCCQGIGIDSGCIIDKLNESSLAYASASGG